MTGNLAESDRPHPRLRPSREDPEALQRAEALLRERGLPASPLTIAPDGADNRVVLAPGHVVRMRGPWGYDHRNESAGAAQARELGVRAPLCVAVQEDYSIWERLPGVNFWRAEEISVRCWRGLFRDLARLHALPPPPDAPRPNLTAWHARVSEIEGLEGGERAVLYRVMQERIPPNRLAFGHGDAHGGNLMVAPDGSFGGLIDWADAGWWPPERDYALLTVDGLREAIDAPYEPLDWSLVATLRVGAMAQNFLAGHVPLDTLRESLGFWELMR
ncbi:MAG: phosphotransferase family protein [Fimbriimonas sp.]